MNQRLFFAAITVFFLNQTQFASAGGFHCGSPGFKQKIKVKGYAAPGGVVVGAPREFYAPSEFFLGGFPIGGGFEFYSPFASREFFFGHNRDSDRGDLKEMVQESVKNGLEAAKKLDSDSGDSPSTVSYSEMRNDVSALNTKLSDVEKIVMEIKEDTIQIRKDLAEVKTTQNKILETVMLENQNRQKEKAEQNAAMYYKLQMDFFQALAKDNEAAQSALSKFREFDPAK